MIGPNGCHLSHCCKLVVSVGVHGHTTHIHHTEGPQLVPLSITNTLKGHYEEYDLCKPAHTIRLKTQRVLRVSKSQCDFVRITNLINVGAGNKTHGLLLFERSHSFDDFIAELFCTENKFISVILAR